MSDELCQTCPCERCKKNNRDQEVENDLKEIADKAENDNIHIGIVGMSSTC